MPIKTDLNVAPYFDDYNENKKYYKLLFVPGNAVQARELTQLQTTLQMQIERFGNNIYKEGSIIEGCNFNNLTSLKYVKVVDGINPSIYVDRTEYDLDNNPVEYWYELEGVTSGLKAYIVAADRGLISKDPDLNTFYVNYLNSSSISGTEVKEFLPNELVLIHEYKYVYQLVGSEWVETKVDNGIVNSTTVASVTDYVGNSYGLTVSSGIVYQRGHFLLVEEQTIILKKYYDPQETDDQGNFLPHNLSVGFFVSEEIVTSQQDLTLLDNANGSPNENAPGAARLKLTPVLVALDKDAARAEPNFFALRRYMNGNAVLTREVSDFNSVGEAMAKRTYEESGDYTIHPIKYEVVRRVPGNVALKISPYTIYSKGYRITSPIDRYYDIDNVEGTMTEDNLLMSYDYGGYLPLAANTVYAGNLDLNTFQTVDLVDNANTAIGSAVVKNYTKDAVYLMAPRMASANTSFAEVAAVKLSSSTIVPVKPTMLETNKNRLVFPLPTSNTQSVDDLIIPIRRHKGSLTISGSQITIAAEIGEEFGNISAQDVHVVSNAGEIINVTSVVVSPSSLTVNVSVASGTATVYYNVNIAPTNPRTKQLETCFIRFTYQTSATKFSLGLPDCFKLKSVTTYSGADDFTDSFVLRSNQTDNFYDHSFVEVIPGKQKPADNDVMLAEVDVFVPDSSGYVYQYYTVNSYADIAVKDVPVFTGATGQYRLADCIDFRPHRIPSVSYAMTSGASDLVSSSLELPAWNSQIFATDSKYVIPADNSFGYVDTEISLSRIDSLVITPQGEMNILKGDEAKNPRAPVLGENTLVASIIVPTSPAFTLSEAKAAGNNGLAVAVANKISRRFTMKDIDKIKTTVDDLQYYVTLSNLEKAAQDMLILDEDGLDRFKSGFLVDSFTSYDVVNMGDSDFNAAIDKNAGILTPAFTQYQLELKPTTTSNLTIYGEKTATLAADGSDVEYIAQENATTYRNAVANFYQYEGQGMLSPEFDTGYDTVTSPPSNIDLDIAGYFEDFAENLQNFIPLTKSQTQNLGTISSSAASSSGRTTTTTTTSTTTFADTTTSLEIGSRQEATDTIAFLEDMTFDPYIRSREVKIWVSGLRPNTRHYFFFDTQNVTQHVAPAILGNDQTVVSISREGAYGDSVLSDAFGNLAAVFKIPAETFFVGDRAIEIMDVDDYGTSTSAAISNAKLMYHAYSFTKTQGSLGINVTAPDFDTANTTTTRTVTTTRSVVVNRGGNGGDRDRNPGRGPTDPVAQTFFVKDNGAGLSTDIFVGSMDLYFKRKSDTNGIRIVVREVENGYPAATILGQTYLRPGQIQVSEDASAVTKLHFPTPIKLSTEKEYAFVCIPDANDPDFILFTSKVGGIDLISGNPVNQDWGEGILFVSTNDRAWHSCQDEDLKFTIYRKNFTEKSGSVDLVPNDYEFLALNSVVGNFEQGELAYNLAANSTVDLVFTEGSHTVSGADVVYLDVDNWLYIDNGPTKQLVRVTGVDLINSEATIDRAPLMYGTHTANFAIVGRVDVFDHRKPDHIVLAASSASVDHKFEVGQTIVGLESGAAAIIDAVDNIEVSYAQPMINHVANAKNTVSAKYLLLNPDAPTDVPALGASASFTSTTNFNLSGSLFYSKSNDLDRSQQAGIRVFLDNAYPDSFSTPMLNVDGGSLYAFTYKTPGRYTSKVATLEDGFDASDLNVWLTGYRPSGTDIKVFAKIQSANDSVGFNTNAWIELERTSKNNVFSSDMLDNDFKEYVYKFPESVMIEDPESFSNVVEYSNSFGTYQKFKKFQIRIDLLADDIRRVPKVADYRAIALR